MNARRYTPAYAEFVRTLSRVLYEVDPDGVGSSIDAPLDEYDDIASKFASKLLGAGSEAEGAEIAREFFDSADDALITQLWAARNDYRASPEPDA
jgi:hypothetical protein